MVCAAGIGVTPLAASMKSILNYRWRYHTGKTFPDQVDCYWVCSYRDLKMFRWFVRTIREVEDTINDITYKNPESIMNKYFQFHLFVTSFKDGQDTEDTSNLRVRLRVLLRRCAGAFKHYSGDRSMARAALRECPRVVLTHARAHAHTLARMLSLPHAGRRRCVLGPAWLNPHDGARRRAVYGGRFVPCHGEPYCGGCDDGKHSHSGGAAGLG